MKGFKTRLLAAMILIAALTWVYHGNSRFQDNLKPLIKYTTTQNYDLISWGTRFWNGKKQEARPAVSTSGFQLPCTYTGIARHFGWYYNPKTNTQMFNPGIFLEIDKDTPVYPVLRGTVSRVVSQENGYQVVIQHSKGLISVVRGLRDTDLKAGRDVEEDSLLGTASDLIYLEVRSTEGPINPESFLSQSSRL